MRRFTAALALLNIGLLGGLFVRDATASRNSSGTYSTPNTFVTGTSISSTAMNSNFSDIATELTDSLSRSGKGGMTAPLRGADGTVAAPAFSFTSETGTGMYRIGASDLGWAVAGSKKLELTGTALSVVPDATLLGSTTKMRIDGSTLAGFTGIYAGAAAAAPTTANYAFAADGTSSTTVNAPTQVVLGVANTTKVLVTSSGLVVGASGTAIASSVAATSTTLGVPTVVTAQTCQSVFSSGLSCTAACDANFTAGFATVGSLSISCGAGQAWVCNGTVGNITMPVGLAFSVRCFN